MGKENSDCRQAGDALGSYTGCLLQTHPGKVDCLQNLFGRTSGHPTQNQVDTSACSACLHRQNPDLQVETQLLVSLLSGAVAGIASSIVSQPADTILTRMNQTPGTNQPAPGTKGIELSLSDGVFHSWKLMGIVRERIHRWISQAASC